MQTYVEFGRLVLAVIIGWILADWVNKTFSVRSRLAIVAVVTLLLFSFGCSNDTGTGILRSHVMVQFRVDGDTDSAAVAATVGGFYVSGVYALPWRQTVEAMEGDEATLSARADSSVLFVEIVSDARIVGSTGGTDYVVTGGEI